MSRQTQGLQGSGLAGLRLTFSRGVEYARIHARYHSKFIVHWGLGSLGAENSVSGDIRSKGLES